MITSYELLNLIANTTFTKFDENDWQTFSGCESENPLIGYVEEQTVILDGRVVVIVDQEGYETQFKLEEI